MATESSPMLPLLSLSSRAPRTRRAAPKMLLALATCAALIVAPLLLFGGSSTPRNSSSDALHAARNAAQSTAAMPSPLAAPSVYPANADGSRDLLAECDEHYFTQTLDHFGAGTPTYEQRYFVCSKHARADNGALFFYVGNEADVELYLNNTGLMWENAAAFGATLVFAEHRYFGKSVPFGKNVTQHMQYLSTEQALADYAELITHIKRTQSLDVPVIGFGGSYGGMLGTWFRIKYPHIVDGVVAGSAPIAAFLGDEQPVDMESFARVTTFDASPAAGAAANCVPNVRRVWPAIAKLGSSTRGRTTLRETFALCDNAPLTTLDDVAALVDWAKSAIDYMAMGNYPYASPYIMNGKSVLPAYPVRVACEYLASDFGESESDDVSLLRAFRDFVGVYYNSTRDATCYSLEPPSEESKHDGDFWQYLFCTELYMPTSINGVDDMFWAVPWNQTADAASCRMQFGVDLRPNWAVTQFGGRKALAAATNIVLSNGDYDPWSGTGVLANVSDSVVAVPIAGGAHHLDLFFSHALDPPSVVAARAIELSHMRKWVAQYYARRASIQA